MWESALLVRVTFSFLDDTLTTSDYDFTEELASLIVLLSLFLLLGLLSSIVSLPWLLAIATIRGWVLFLTVGEAAVLALLALATLLECEANAFGSLLLAQLLLFLRLLLSFSLVLRHFSPVRLQSQHCDVILHVQLYGFLLGGLLR